MGLLRVLARGGCGRQCFVNNGQRGYTLVEVIVAVAIVGVIAVAFLSALTSGYLALALADENTVAESLTRTEFERVRDADYPIVLPDPDAGIVGNYPRHRDVLGDLYDVDIDVDPPVDPEAEQRPIQLVTVTISHQGDVVLITETYKADPRKGVLN